MEGIREPVARPTLALLRRAVLDHVTTERRQRFAPRLQVGRPGGPTEVFAAASGEGWDAALRTDVFAALLHRARRPGVVPVAWLTRPGDLELQDVDAGWAQAARAAAAEAGCAVTFVVVTRHGWLDPRSGVRREWQRLRRR